MDGMHDLGGKQGFGPVQYAPNTPAFHAEWEKRVNAMYGLAVRQGIFNMDEYRHAIERMEPRHYLSASYFERTLTSLATLLVEKGLATHDEIKALAQGDFPLAQPGQPGRGNLPQRQAFRIGDKVAVRSEHVPGHHRLPAYVRGKSGIVVGISPAYPFPDAHAHSLPADDEPTYDVRFSSADLWPQNADAAFVHVGVFESYLQPGTDRQDPV